MYYKRRFLTVVSAIALMVSACIIPFISGDSVGKGDMPSYPRSKSVDVSEQDQIAFVAEILGRENTLFQSTTKTFWVKDMGETVLETFDENLPDKNWRIESDWMGFETLFLSSWRKGDLNLFIIVVDNLDSETLSDLNKQYGMSGPQAGGTLVVLHLIDTTESLPDKTATSEAASFDATATTEAIEAAEKATQAFQSTATARAEVQQSLIEFSDEFNESQLAEHWNIYRPDPQKWDLSTEPGLLHIVGAPERDSGILNVFGIRLNPSDIEVVTKVESKNMLNDGNAAWIAFTPEDYPPSVGYSVEIGLAFDDYDGYFIYMWACDRENCGWGANRLGNEEIDFTGIVYLKLVREGKDYSGFYSLDGEAWTFVGEYKEFPIIVDQVTLAAGGGREEFDTYFDFIHFDVPQGP